MLSDTSITSEAGSSENAARASLPTPNGNTLPSKLRPPRGRPGHVVRARLIEALSHDIERQLTIVVAPAGYGKSTLVAQWLDRTSLPWAWISLGLEDDSPRSMLKLLAAAIRTIDPDLVDGATSLMTDSSQLGDEQLANVFIENLSRASRHFLLVIDDIHLIESPEVWALMHTFQHALSDIVRLVLIGRSEPHLPLARLRVAGELAQFGPEELAFTRQESAEFLDASNFALTNIDLDRLHDATEGWVAALKLASIALADLPPSQLHQRLEFMEGRRLPVLGSYLWQEVYDRQPETLKTFLLQSSLLDRFCEELCNAAFGDLDSAGMIRECITRRLFLISLDDTEDWYRYHHLVQDLLRTKATATLDPEELRQLHSRASLWLEDHGFHDEAISHAIAASDWDRASQLVEGVCRDFFNQDCVHELAAALSRLPHDVILTRLPLVFFLAWVKARTGKWPEAIAVMQNSQDAWNQSTDPEEQGLYHLFYCLRGLASIDAQMALAHGERALALLTPEWPFPYGFALLNTCIAHIFAGQLHEYRPTSVRLRQFAEQFHLDRVLLLEGMYASGAMASEGKLTESTALARSVILSTGSNRTAIWLQPAYLQLGMNCRELGLLDDALDALQSARQLAISTQSHLWSSRIHLAIAMVHWSMGDHQAALAEINPAAEYANRLGMLDHPRRVRALEARFFLGLGQLELARRWVETAALDPMSTTTYMRQKEYLTFIRFLIHDQRADEALTIVREMRRDAETNGRFGDLIELGILETLAHRSKGRPADAVRALVPALEFGEREGYLQAFVDDGLALGPVLRYLLSHSNQRRYIQKLLTLIDGTPLPAMPNQSALIDELSQRELEVFRLVAEGLANREVGERLFISEKTVKKHVSNILSKLGASNRTQAVDIGRRTQLI